MSKKLAEIKVNELSEALIKINENEALDETLIDEINGLMAILYSDFTKMCNKSLGEEDLNDPSYNPDPPAYELIKFVDDTDQFLEDYKNAIDFCLYSGGFISNLDEAISSIKKLRSHSL